MSRSFTGDRIEEVIAVDLGQPVNISIENTQGEVMVRGVDRDDVLIRAEKHGNSSSVAYQEAALRIDTGAGRIAISPILPGNTSPGRSVSVDLGLDIGADFLRDLLEPDRRSDDRDQQRRERRERKGRGFSVTWDSNVSYEIEIEVPRSLDCHLTINTASGEISVNGVGGSLNLTTASGDVDLRQITGEVRFNTASGDLEIQQLTGMVDGRTASGDVQIEQAALRAFNFQTASGDLSLDAALTGDGPYAAKTVSGDCKLALAAIDPATGRDRAFTVSFKSMSGDARLGDEFQPRGGGHWATVAGIPGPHLAVSTVSGDLRGTVGASSGATSLARQAGEPTGRPSAAPIMPAAAHVPTPPPPPAPPMMPKAAPAAPPVPVTQATPESEPESVSGVGHTGGAEAGASSRMADADRLALLEAVERGEVDIEEALRQLDDRADDQPDAE
jgi:hypothetical protein